MKNRHPRKKGSLRGTVAELINADPSVKWTTKSILAKLVETGYPLRAKQPVYSIGQILSKLVANGTIRIARKGSGSEPNIYKGKRVDLSADTSEGNSVEIDEELNLAS